MKSFSAKLLKIGINPYVLLPEFVLQLLFKQAVKDKALFPYVVHWHISNAMAGCINLIPKRMHGLMV
jgi:hypothetical protein